MSTTTDSKIIKNEGNPCYAFKSGMLEGILNSLTYTSITPGLQNLSEKNRLLLQNHIEKEIIRAHSESIAYGKQWNTSC